MSIIQFPGNSTINVKAIQSNSRKVSSGLLAPATEPVEQVLAVDHTSEPIKSLDDIQRISDYFLQNGKYRDNMLFIVGINFGLRVSDLRLLRFCDLIIETPQGQMFKEGFPVFEVKTRNTRKRKKNRYITINDAVMEAVLTYLTHTEGVSLSDYMFMNESNNRGKVGDTSSAKPLDRKSVDRILKGVGEALNLDIKISTHTLRKTWAYHQMVMSNNDPRKLLLLQKMMGHSSAAQTLDYIGITGEEIQEAYKMLNLGSTSKNYLVNSTVVEKEVNAC